MLFFACGSKEIMVFSVVLAAKPPKQRKSGCFHPAGGGKARGAASTNADCVRRVVQKTY
jgi:hypothetical protein